MRTWISPPFTSCKTRLDQEAEPDGVLLLVEALCRLVFLQVDGSSINNASHTDLTGVRLEPSVVLPVAAVLAAADLLSMWIAVSGAVRSEPGTISVPVWGVQPWVYL